MKPINRNALDRAAVEKLLSQQIVLSVATVPRTVWLKAYFVEHTKGMYARRYEVVTMNDVVLNTVNLEEAIAKFTDLTEPTPVVEEVVIRNDKVDVLRVVECTEPSPEF